MNDSSLSRGPRTPVVRMRSLGIRLHIIATPCGTHLNSRRVSVEFSPIRGRVWKRDGTGSCALLCQSFPSSSRSSNVFLDKNKQQIHRIILHHYYSIYIRHIFHWIVQLDVSFSRIMWCAGEEERQVD